MIKFVEEKMKEESRLKNQQHLTIGKAISVAIAPLPLAITVTTNMKNIILIFLILFSVVSFGQQYDGVHIERSKIDKNNKIFTLGKEYTYKIEIIEKGTLLFLKKNNVETFELTKNNDSVYISEINLTVIKPKWFKRTNNRQTEVYYSYGKKPTSFSTTGIVDNDINIWVHPPRDGFLKSLETCPFPYVKLDKPIGYKWKDSMSIGNHWSNKKWGKWNGRLLLNYEYEIKGTETIHSEFGKIDCIVIKAIASSSIGKSKLTAYFSKKYGFIKLNYILFNGIEINLDIKDIKNRPILRNANDFFNKRDHE